MLTVGGLFSGIGGIELGLERAGMRVLWHCEADPYARAVLEQHWLGVPCYDDVRELRGADVAPVDVLCGGFPCQDISLAGRGAGIDGARSGLWSEYARLVGELRPRYVVVENVPALLGRGLGRVLGDLADVGYDAEWDCVSAADFGAPHLRKRLWLVAYPGGPRRRQDARGTHGDEGQDARRPAQDDHVAGGAGAQRLPAGGRDRGSAAHPDAHGEGRGVVAQHNGGPLELGGRPPGGHADRLRDEVADAASLGHERPGQARNGRPGPAHGGRGSGGEQAVAGLADWWATEPDVGRVAHGIPKRVDRLRCLGNAVVPQIPEWIGTRIIEWEGRVAA